MKIILANKFYYPRGGDCIYTMELEKLLKQKGHEVAIFSMEHVDNLRTSYKKYFPSEVSLVGAKNKMKFLLRPFGTNEVKNKFQKLINDFKPDIIHLNNIHSQLSPILAEVAWKNKIRVIWTMHDYKLLCPRYDYLKNGRTICEECFKNKKYVVKNKCMKGSLLASVIAYAESEKWNKNKLEKYTNSFICPSSFMKEKMLQGGFKEKKLHILNNFINEEKLENDVKKKEDYYCYLGRLSHEKGIKTLIDAAKDLPYKLKIIGTGPLMDELTKTTTNNSTIEFLGFKNWDEIKPIIQRARFVVVPSEWYEVFGLVNIEALCLGTPVLGANIGGIPELIDQKENGILFQPGNIEDLKTKIKEMFALPVDYNNIMQNAKKRYSSNKYYEELIRIYTN